MSMYEKVQNQPVKKRSNRLIFIIIAICVAVIVILGVTIFLPMIRRDAYWDLVSGLSADTNAGFAQNSITCTYEGETFKVDGDTASELYMKLIYREDVDMKLIVPEAKPGIHIDYGTGGTLDIWPVPHKNKLGAELICIGVLYRSPAGKKYSFTSYDHYFNTYEALINNIR